MTIRYETRDEVGVFTIDNGKLNLVTVEMHKQLCLRLYDFLYDNSIKVGIMIGADDRCFSAGDDLKEDILPIHAKPDWRQMSSLTGRNKPIIGAVRGWCLGAGMFYLMLMTDIRIATPEAKFGFPEIAYGMGGAGGATRLGRQIPHTVAMHMLLTGDYMTAQHACDVHLINEVVDDEQLMERSMEIAWRIARHPLIGIRTEMEAYYRGLELSKNDALSLTRTLYQYQRELDLAQKGDTKEYTFKDMKPLIKETGDR
jgi:enoyl-CoA hydratase/carnithine racemase